MERKNAPPRPGRAAAIADAAEHENATDYARVIVIGQTSAVSSMMIESSGDRPPFASASWASVSVRSVSLFNSIGFGVFSSMFVFLSVRVAAGLAGRFAALEHGVGQRQKGDDAACDAEIGAIGDPLDACEHTAAPCAHAAAHIAAHTRRDRAAPALGTRAAMAPSDLLTED